MNQRLEEELGKVDVRCLRATLGNRTWLKANFNSIVKSLPENWKSVPDLILPFGFAIKCLGVDWREESQVVVALYWLNHIGIAETRLDPHAAEGSTRSLIYRRSPNCTATLSHLS